MMHSLYCFLCKFLFHLSFGVIKLCDEGHCVQGKKESFSEECDACQAEAFDVSCDDGSTAGCECDEDCMEDCEPTSCKTPCQYAKSAEHLNDELRVIDLLVRAEACRWFETIGCHKRPEDWGMLNVNPQEIKAYLNSPQTRFGEVSAESSCSAKCFIDQAKKLRCKVRAARNQTSGEVRLALRDFQRRLEVPDTEVDPLLLALLPSLDSRYRRLFAILQDNGTLARPTADFMLRVLSPMTDGSIAEDRRAFTKGNLWKYHVLDAGDDPQLPFLMQPIVLDEPIVNFLLDEEGEAAEATASDVSILEPNLANVLIGRRRGISLDELILQDDQIETLKSLHPVFSGNPQAINFSGPYGSGRQHAARALAGSLGKVLVGDMAAGLTEPSSFKKIIDIFYRDARLHQTFLHWKNAEVLEKPEVDSELKSHVWQRVADEPVTTTFSSTTLLSTTGHFHATRNPLIQIPMPMPSQEIREQLWHRFLPPAAYFDDASGEQRKALSKSLAKTFHLTAGQIQDAVASARGIAVRNQKVTPRITVQDIEHACRAQSGRGLHSIAKHIAHRDNLSFEELILHKPTKRVLEAFTNRIEEQANVFEAYGFDRKHRLGKGLLGMFTGPSGCGKTLAAEVIASKVRRDLYQVDVSQIVSKWVGETEKNLERVFVEAADSDAILFFDEADAFFGKRGEVKEAKDRWANQEVNYLLQRIEEYSGVVIMTTNLPQNIDEAFARRIQYMIDFPFPDELMRLKLWQNLLKKEYSHGEARTRQVPIHELTELEIKFLADRFPLSGGTIRNIVFDAAFRECENDREQRERWPFQRDDPPKLDFYRILETIAREYQKQGKPIRRGDFGKENFDRIMETLYPQDAVA